MQPWNFLVIRSPETKNKVHEGFRRANEEAAAMFPPVRRDKYRGFKLEGIREAPVNVLVTCDRGRSGPVVIGRTAQRDMDLFSTVCAVQNLWLAARAEGIGMGWVSIVREETLREIFTLPPQVAVVAYLCLGRVRHFLPVPELEHAGWLPRLDVRDLVFSERWGRKSELFASIRR